MEMDILEEKVIISQIIFIYYILPFTFYVSGTEGKIERATHIDFNGDGFIGRLPDTIPGGGFPPMNPNSGFGGFPQGGYGGPY